MFQQCNHKRIITTSTMISITGNWRAIFRELPKSRTLPKSRACNITSKVPSIGKGNKLKSNTSIKRIRRWIGASRTARLMMFEYFSYTSRHLKTITESIPIASSESSLTPPLYLLLVKSIKTILHRRSLRLNK